MVNGRRGVSGGSVLRLLALALCLALVAASEARSVDLDVETVLYGKSSNQIQFVVCFEASDPSTGTIDLGTEQLDTIQWTARGPSGGVVGTGQSPPPGMQYAGHSLGTCRYLYFEAYDLRDLIPGTTYTIETLATLRSPSGPSRTLADTMTVTTTGGCPLDAPAESPPRYTYLHAIIDDQNVSEDKQLVVEASGADGTTREVEVIPVDNLFNVT